MKSPSTADIVRTGAAIDFDLDQGSSMLTPFSSAVSADMQDFQ